MTIKAYLEFLFHFTCGECGKWFSIGDWKQHDYLTCPHCGIEQKVVSANDTTEWFMREED